MHGAIPFDLVKRTKQEPVGLVRETRVRSARQVSASPLRKSIAGPTFKKSGFEPEMMSCR